MVPLRSRQSRAKRKDQGFVHATKREAWASIRGYYFQAQATVLRWTELEDDDTFLLCECAEDIDHIGRAFIKNSTGRWLPERLLEQVKVREHPVTLRSPSVFEALAHLREAQVANPRIKVRLRFTCNASPSKEQNSPFRGPWTGIEVCERLTTADISPTEVAETLKAFRTIICQRFEERSSPVLRRKHVGFLNFVRSTSDERLLDFLSSIEWALGQPTDEGLREKIGLRLARVNPELQGAMEQAIDRLTIIVIQTMSSRGSRILNRPKLRRALANLRFSASEKRLQRSLRRLEGVLTSQLQKIATTTSATQAGVERIEEVLSRWSSLFGGGLAGIPVNVRVSLPRLDTAPQPPVPFSARQTLMTHVLGLLTPPKWIHLHGGIGMGKTQLARSVASQFSSQSTLWVSLVGRSEESAPTLCQHIDEQFIVWLVHVTQDPSLWTALLSSQKPDISSKLRKVRTVCGQPLIVIDDLPDPSAQPLLYEYITSVAASCRAEAVPLITTGQHPLPPNVTRRFPAPTVMDFSVYPMDDTDILDLLLAAGSPRKYNSNNLASLIKAATAGHPTLASAAVWWLRSRNWPLDWNELFSVLSGEAMARERDFAARLMVQLLRNKEQRELLDRLSLISRPFEAKIVDLVAAIPAKLQRPGELLSELVGPWIQRTEDEQYEVSPLLRDAGEKHLSAETQRRVHLHVASHLLGARPTPVDDGLRAIVHLSKAKAWTRVATVVIGIMVSARTSAHARHISLLNHFFLTTPWPNEIHFDLRVVIRALQVKTARLAGEDATALDNDLDALLSVARTRASASQAVVFALLNAGTFSPESPFKIAVRRSVEAVLIMQKDPELSRMLRAAGSSPADIAWLRVTQIQDLTDVQALVDIWEGLGTDDLRSLFLSELSGECVHIVATKCWSITSHKAAEERDWDAALRMLDRIAALGTSQGIPTLQIAAQIARAVALADYLDRSGEAVQLLQGVETPEDKDLAFLLHYYMGRILDEVGNSKEAIVAYERALSYGGKDYAIYRLSSYGHLAKAYCLTGDWTAGVNAAIRGTRFAKSCTIVNPLQDSSLSLPPITSTAATEERAAPALALAYLPMLEVLELYGELAVALWGAGIRKRACAALTVLVRRLLTHWDPTSPRYREVFRKTTVVLQYYAFGVTIKASTQTPATPSSKILASPGIFVTRMEGFGEASDPPLIRETIVYGLGHLAANLDLRHHAFKLLSRAASLAKESGLLRLRCAILSSRAAVAASLGRFAGAVSDALEAVKGPAMDHARDQKDAGTLLTVLDPDEVWATLTEAQKEDAQRDLFWFVIAPAMAHALASLSIPHVVATWSKQLFLQSGKIGNPEHWRAILGLAEDILAHVPRATARARISAVTERDEQLLLMTWLSLSESTGCHLEEALNSHTFVFLAIRAQAFLPKVMLNDFSNYIISYWSKVADTKGLLLQSPREFKAKMVGMTFNRDAIRASEVLLLANDALGQSLAPETRSKLEQG